MGYLAEKYNYLKGLCDGIGIDESETKEGKVLKAMMEFMDEVVLSVEDLEYAVDDLEEIIDECCEDDCGCDCDCCDDCDCDEIINEVECPECEGVFVLTEDLFSDDGDYIECPLCNEKIELDWSDLDCDCGCPDCECNDAEG